MRRRLAAISSVAIVVLALSGCGAPAENRYAAAPADGPPAPSLDATQVGRILKAVDGAVSAAWPKRQTGRLNERADGPFLAITAHSFAVAVKRKQKLKNQPVERSLVVVPVDDGWPRFFLTVGTRAGSEAPLVQVFKSASGREPYALWGELTLLPGQEWPQTSTDPAEVVTLDPGADADELGLVLSPSAAVQRYANVLTKGKKATGGSAFSKDDFGTQVRERITEEAKTLKAVASVTSIHAVAKGGVLALRLADGSALVIGELVQKHVISVKKDSGTVMIRNADIVALLGKKSIKKSLSREAIEVVAIRVPATGMGKATVIAAGKGDVKVSGS